MPYSEVLSSVKRSVGLTPGQTAAKSIDNIIGGITRSVDTLKENAKSLDAQIKINADEISKLERENRALVSKRDDVNAFVERVQEFGGGLLTT